MTGHETGGSASVEAAILAVGVGVLIAFAIAGGRLVSAEAAADHAAAAAARAASLQRDGATAAAAGERAGRASLDEQGLRCASLDLRVDAAAFDTPIGTPATVRVSVSCTVDWADLGLPVSGVRVVRADAVSPVDRWRERT